MSERPSRGRGQKSRSDKSTTKPGGDGSMSQAVSVSGVGSSSQAPSFISGASCITGAVVAAMAQGPAVGELAQLMQGTSLAPSGDSTNRPSSSSSSDFSDTLVKRPNYAVTGRAIQLRTNNFVVNIQSALPISQYRVEISSEFRKMKKEDNFIIFWHVLHSLKWIENPYSTLYDGGNICFSLTDLPVGLDGFRATVEVSLPRFSRPGQYTVVFSATGRMTFDFNDDSRRGLAMTILDMVYRQYFNMPIKYNPDEPEKELAKKFSCFGRSFFYSPTADDKLGFDLDAGRQVWGGYFFGSKIGANMKPIVNIDVANSVFIKRQSVLEYMCEVLNQAANQRLYGMEQLEQLKEPYTLPQKELQIFVKALKGLSVSTLTAPDRGQKVFSVTAQAAEQLLFEWKEGANETQKVSVADYFVRRYNKPLRYPFFPCLEVGSKGRFAYLPLEICHMFAPQRVTGKLSELQTSTMIKGVCTDAMERERRIMGVISKAQLDMDPFAKRFGLQINMKMMETVGRMIHPPALEYQNNQRVTPREGAWNMGNTKFVIPAAISSYGVVSFVDQRNETELANFCRVLMQTGLQMGMVIGSQMPDSVLYVRSVDRLQEAMAACIRECSSKGKNCELIIIPMVSKNTENYSAVKSIAEKELGVVTQVVLHKNIRMAKQQTCQNIALKLNAKLGGVNCKLNVDEVSRKYLVNQPTLILGIDVTHPAPTDRKAPSIGAAVGNIDMLPGKFGASISVQKHRREAVVYLTDAITKRVEAFYRQTQVKPERIIVYRDGVAEGQFKEVLTEELKNIRKACIALGGEDYKPKITFIVVQKRHHTRFFCVNQGDMCGKGKNVPPGTVVDSVITHPSQFDFFLCSHYGIQGTSRPAHYHVLIDENKFKSEELQAITYNLCHLYFRCNRSVSIPAPTYYAHLACARARHHMHSVIGDATSETFSESGQSSSDSNTTEEEIRKSVEVVESMLTKMYFC